ncbi:hypothetical protein [Prescottella equi]|uniref:hypothetical protein n=1 Tax=Rhodococcus hoagii TaxID=43767 RepID=UPI000A0F4D38|nr:hypothetical protein [Prescottella equi]ORL15391.1 hypothetical protein A6I85_05810 [Prescottella equi]
MSTIRNTRTLARESGFILSVRGDSFQLVRCTIHGAGCTTDTRTGNHWRSHELVLETNSLDEVREVITQESTLEDDHLTDSIDTEVDDSPMDDATLAAVVEAAVENTVEEGELTLLDLALILEYHFGINPFGDIDLTVSGGPLLIWFSCTQNFKRALTKLMADPRVTLERSSAAPYSFEITGVELAYPPLVSDYLPGDYSPRWFPTIFRPAAA